MQSLMTDAQHSMCACVLCLFHWWQDLAVVNGFRSTILGKNLPLALLPDDTIDILDYGYVV